jgi:hypothetical protein
MLIPDGTTATVIFTVLAMLAGRTVPDIELHSG